MKEQSKTFILKDEKLSKVPLYDQERIQRLLLPIKFRVERDEYNRVTLIRKLGG